MTISVSVKKGVIVPFLSMTIRCLEVEARERVNLWKKKIFMAPVIEKLLWVVVVIAHWLLPFHFASPPYAERYFIAHTKGHTR